ncbi:MAG: pitrilysin family protein [Planctomycetota bacterium]|nr:pitrilysin family protein [Planctomycetota bacterium]
MLLKEVLSRTNTLWFLFCFLLLLKPSMSIGQTPDPITSVEGITEYQLENGLKVLLFPDDSKPTVTVNLTLFVGSRHEGYGEAGMAHLLEHMLFKGTPSHPNIPKSLQDLGAQFNGTTWVDRTNYYETLPASEENLEFALRLEADRMVNSLIRGEDLESEMTVVRSEFESGENSPLRILLQRMQAAAYEWHNYGKSTIGNRSDIERVPITNLRAFYRKHYQPDNAMLIVAGKFDRAKALELILKHFGPLGRPDRELDKTYTEEPAQDGERTVVLRRVGDVSLVAAAYHIPASSHPDFPAIRVLQNLMTSEPGGKLYKALVESKKAATVLGTAFAFHDPGLALFGAIVPEGTPTGEETTALETARVSLLETLENYGEGEISAEEVNRAKEELLAGRERELANSQGLAVSLSDWAAQGDWRLFFLYRDRLEKVTVEDVQRVAKAYLQRNNRTVGLFIPTEKAERIEIPPAPDVAAMVEGYEGRELVAEGEVFDPDPVNIEKRVQRGELKTGLKYGLLPKKTRGEMVYLQLTLRYGSESTLLGKDIACELVADAMMRGASYLSYQDIQDELNRARATMSAAGQRGLALFSVQTKREFLPEVIELLRKVVREPTFAKEEFELLRQEIVADLESQLSDPQALAGNALRRAMSPYPEDSIHYVPTLEEELEQYKSVTLDDTVSIYQDLMNGVHGEVVIVGDFETSAVMPSLETLVENWESEAAFARIPEAAQVDLPGREITIETPDKANAVYLAGLNLAIKDGDADFAPLVMANFILGGGSLASRLGDRVRQQEGLSYGIRSGFSAHPIDDRGRLTISAITNPINRTKLEKAISEELNRWIEEGITEEELKRAQQGYLQGQQLQRSNDRVLTGLIGSTLFAGRTLDYYADLEKAIGRLYPEAVNETVRERISSNKLIQVFAGDVGAKE